MNRPGFARILFDKKPDEFFGGYIDVLYYFF